MIYFFDRLITFNNKVYQKYFHTPHHSFFLIYKMGKAQSKDVIEEIDLNFSKYFADGNLTKEFSYNHTFWKDLFSLPISLTPGIVAKLSTVLSTFCI